MKRLPQKQGKKEESKKERSGSVDVMVDVSAVVLYCCIAVWNAQDARL